jgi:hypothetical protein
MSREATKEYTLLMRKRYDEENGDRSSMLRASTDFVIPEIDCCAAWLGRWIRGNKACFRREMAGVRRDQVLSDVVQVELCGGRGTTEVYVGYVSAYC